MPSEPSQARFAPTRWSLVRRARDGDEPGRRALAELCALYWPPVYAFFRRDGMAADDARDLTQGLFAELLERGDVAGNRPGDEPGDGAGVGPGRGRFRSYLLACARHYRSNQRDRERAQKRGAGRQPLPFAIGEPEDDAAAGTVVHVAARDPTPEQAYLASWVRATVAHAVGELAREEQAKGRAAQFALLRPTLEGETLSEGYAAIAARLDVTEAAVKVAVHRLRQRFRTALLRELGATVEHAADAEAELRELFAALAPAGSPS